MIFTQRGLNIYALIKRPKGAVHKELSDRQKVLRGPMTFDILDELERNNNERAKKMIKEMGDKWVCHPKHSVKRKDKVNKW